MSSEFQRNRFISKDSHVFLMAEDDPADAEVFSEMLSKAFDDSHSVVCVDRFEKIVEALNSGSFQALILDMNLPDRSGIDNVHHLGKQYPSLPIVVLTGNEDLDLAIDSLQSGAQDYLSKNKVTPEMLARSLHYAKERKQIEQRLKEALEDSAYKNLQLEAQARHDPLTGLANRAYFQEVAKRVLLRAQRKNLKAALLYFDLNEFKKINDTYGHLAGDNLLQQVSERLLHVVRETDFLARIGGDEFVIITDTIADKREVYPLVKRIKTQFDSAFDIGPHQLTMSSSIGIAFYPEADNLDLLIKQADCAMYEAKANPDSSTCFFSEQIAAQYARSQKIESLLGQAIEKHQLSATFQPVINLDNENEVHVEALARWHCNNLGEISPDEFIPIAENTPAISGISREMTSQAKKLFEALLHCKLNINCVSINISAMQLASKHFCRLLLQWLDEANLPPNKICLELTERQVVQNIEKCKEQFLMLKSKGIQIALDDFGSGFSSVTHLLDLPFDVLKLDRVLVSYIDQNPRNQALVAGIVEMAHRLDMKVVAEGVEREEEKQVAIDLGCDFLQGYLIAKPLSLHEAALFYELRK